MRMIAGRNFLATMLLVALVCTSFVATVRSQDDGEELVTESSEAENGTEESETTDAEDVELPIGMELAATFREMVEAHKSQIRTIIEEFKFNNSENHEERLRIIEDYHNKTRLRLETMKGEKRLLSELFRNGTIDHDEFVVRMRLLHARLKGSEKITEKLGWQLSEVAKTAAEQHRQKAQMLKELHQQMRDEIKAARREMKEQLKTHGPSWKTSETTTETTSTGKKGGGKGKDKKKDRSGAEPGGDS